MVDLFNPKSLSFVVKNFLTRFLKIKAKFMGAILGIYTQEDAFLNLKSMPIKLLSTFLVTSIMLFAYVLRISERPIIYTNPNLKNLQMNFSEWSNALWCVVVSISTSK